MGHDPRGSVVVEVGGTELVEGGGEQVAQGLGVLVGAGEFAQGGGVVAAGQGQGCPPGHLLGGQVTDVGAGSGAVERVHRSSVARVSG